MAENVIFVDVSQLNWPLGTLCIRIKWLEEEGRRWIICFRISHVSLSGLRDTKVSEHIQVNAFD